LAQILIQSDATLSINLDLDHIGSHGTQFGPGLFATLDRLGHFSSPSQRDRDCDHTDAFVLPKNQIATRFETVSEGRRKRDSTLGVKLTLVPSNETFH
jgi:hypothetical protein